MRLTATTVCMFLFLLFTSGIKAQDNASLLQIVTQRAAQLQLTSEEARSSVVSSTYEDEKTGIRYLYLQQSHKGVKVFNSIKTVILRNNEVLYSSGRYFNEIEKKAGGANPQVTATSAVSAAAEHLKLRAPQDLRIISDAFATEKKLTFSPAGIAKQDISAELFWVASDDGQTIRLAWNINIDVLHSSDWWNVRIDALTGNYIEKDNWTVYEAPHDEHKEHKTNTIKWAPEVGTGQKPFTPPTVTSAQYRVFPFPLESPNSGTHAIETNPWLKAGAGNNAITNGWHFDGNSNYTITRGNNVFAYLDIAPSNTPTSSNWPDTSSTADPSLTFTSTPSLGLQPDNIQNRKSAVTNLFYWNNIIHDITYQYGFNEASGNFQTDNLSRGGQGNDYVQAEAQDASGTDNANFATPADGARPRMQMFLWSAVPKVIVNAPASIAGNYDAVEGAFSTANQLSTTGPVTGSVVWYEDGGANEACVPPTNSLTGKIALINRGNCNFTVKVKNAQDAGAIGVIVINNVPGAPIVMGGSDNTITIPAMMVSDGIGATLASQIATLNVTLSPGVKVDGDYDNGVVVHEFGHGISNRLTGGRTNASCLNNAEQAGEGWSDYFSLMLTHKWPTAALTDGAQKRAIGNYVIGMNSAGPGIRNFPYSTNMANNPHTYADLANISTQVHYIGEVWCSALWDMTWNIIQQVGFIEPNIYNAGSNGGNAIAMRLVMEGLKLQPCRPGFLDARDAILAADSILYNGAYKCAIWRAFARRGMGVSAVQGLSTNASDNVAAYDVPSAVTLTKSSMPEAINSGSNHTVTLSASCQCTAPVGNFTIRDTIPAGFSYVSSSAGGTVAGNVVSFPSISFATAGEVKTFSVTIKADAAGCAVDTIINDNREAATTGGLTPITIVGSANWSTSTLQKRSGTTSWFATGHPATGDYVLVSNSYPAGQMSILSFWHYYVMENKNDGSRVEISPDNGTTWLDAGPYMVQNGYNTKMIAASPWGTGADAFSGVSYGQTSGNFKHTVINLAPFSGATVKIRFRVQTSAANQGTYEGWFVDDIMLLNGCGGTVKAGLYNNAGAKIDSAAFPVFIRPSINGPATILNQPGDGFACPGGNVSFTVNASSSQPMTFQWQLSTDGGATFNNIAGATSSTYTVTGVTSSMNGHRYRVVINNGNGATTSANATLSLTAAPTVSAVASSTACSGSSVSFTSTTTGAGVTYQWQVSTDGGVTYTNVSGGTAATLNLTNITTSQNNNRYRLVATNNCGVATSDHGTLIVNSAPAVTLAPVATLCSSDGPAQLTASINGGTWSGTGVSGSTFNPAGLTPGNYPVGYSVTGTNGCTSTSSMQVTVQACASTTLPLDAPGAVILVVNPSAAKYHLRFNTGAYARVKMIIHESDGRQIYGREINGITFGHTEPIYTDNLAAGVYLVTIFDDGTGKQKTFKMVVGRK